MKAYHKDTIDFYYNKLREIKIGLLLTQCTMAGEDGYTETMDSLCDQIDLALEETLDKLERLVNMM